MELRGCVVRCGGMYTISYTKIWYA
eukprot:SAG31_NODE_47350_length_248_cov_4.161074_1_plen_24_part_10